MEEEYMVSGRKELIDFRIKTENSSPSPKNSVHRAKNEELNEWQLEP
jgi:hypothetical protein